MTHKSHQTTKEDSQPHANEQTGIVEFDDFDFPTGVTVLTEPPSEFDDFDFPTGVTTIKPEAKVPEDKPVAQAAGSLVVRGAEEVEEYDFPTGVTALPADAPEDSETTQPYPEDHELRSDSGGGVTMVIPLEEPEVAQVERIGAVFDEVVDSFATAYAPSVHESFEEGSSDLLERLLPAEFVHKIRRVSGRYESGHMYRRIKTAGSEEKHSNHPHYYYLDKTKPGVTRVYFVDPEHKIAARTHKENRIYKRPSVANLVAAEIPDDETVSAKIAILRYRIPLESEDPRFIESGSVSPQVQVEAAREMLDPLGQPPAILAGDMHKEIKYHLAANEGYSRVQAVQSDNRDMRLFARGETGSRALEHKVKMQRRVLNTLIAMFEDPKHTDVRTVA